MSRTQCQQALTACAPLHSCGAGQLEAAEQDNGAKAANLQGLQKQAGMLGVQLRSAEQGRLAAEDQAQTASAEVKVRLACALSFVIATSAALPTGTRTIA